MKSPRLTGLFTCVLLVSSLTGCTSLSLAPSLTALKFWDRPTDQPIVEIMALWQPGEGRDTRGLPARGFAGQVFFFPQGSKTPAKVTGDVKIYVFDDQGSEAEKAQPIHVYEFKQGAWNAYFSETNIGPAYQVFIPYPREGDHLAVCSLRVKHSGPDGDTLLSDAADVILVGKKTKPETSKTVSTPHPARPSTLSQQQTHLATIDKHGHVQAPEGSPSNRTQEIKSVAYQKNTLNLNYQEKPGQTTPSTQPPVIQQASHHEVAEPNVPSAIGHPLSQTRTTDQPGHPLTNSQKTLPQRNSSLKVKTIRLE